MIVEFLRLRKHKCRLFEITFVIFQPLCLFPPFFSLLAHIPSFLDIALWDIALELDLQRGSGKLITLLLDPGTSMQMHQVNFPSRVNICNTQRSSDCFLWSGVRMIAESLGLRKRKCRLLRIPFVILFSQLAFFLYFSAYQPISIVFGYCCVGHSIET